ncbi:hypothetical protein ABT354_13980 [Streptomyces sp. NPDC000594]|uniref:hypothetical protein n=1 Tax=Streptomyces sp. NPDC000594 TaxID=3154261 RepID=UPI00332EAFE7
MPASTAPGRDATPATLLGPTALVLGTLALCTTWLPLLMEDLVWLWAPFPFIMLAGAFSVTAGAAGIHYARRGECRLWDSVVGTVFGAAGFAGCLTLVMAMFSG